jgi:hypothetical protein
LKEVISVPTDNNSDIFTGLAIAGVLGVAGYFLYTNFLNKEEEGGTEEEYIPAKIAQPMVVYEDRFPDFYPYRSFANPARRPYFGGTPIPIPPQSIYVPPPTLAYWNPAYPNTDNRK